MKRRFEVTVEASSNWFVTPVDDAEDIQEALVQGYGNDIAVTVKPIKDVATHMTYEDLAKRNDERAKPKEVS